MAPENLESSGSNPRRPLPTKPGELVQTDTIHYVCPYTYTRKYIYTVIDLYARMAYARASDRIAPGEAAKTILEARKRFGFDLKMVQRDNGLRIQSLFRTTNASSRYTNQTQPATPTQRQRPHRTL